MLRREFLKTLIASTVGYRCFGAGSMLLPSIADAAVNKTLVVIFQRGGCDGLNTCIPYGDTHYAALRPNIAIEPPSEDNPAAAIDLNGFFGLHPGLATFKPIYEAGDLAIFPATHYANSSHSHFDGQKNIESASTSKKLDGWLNRYLQLTQLTSRTPALAIGGNLPHALRGEILVSAMQDVASYSLVSDQAFEQRLVSDLHAIYTSSVTTDVYHKKLHETGLSLLSDAQQMRALNLETYVPANGAVYSDSKLARQLKQVAQLIQTDIGLQIVTLESNGWDTHSSQGGGQDNGRQFLLHQQLSSAMAAFYTDLGPKMEDIVLLTCTEFGRTAKENGSGGTDHGNAATWFVMGGAIQGDIYGEWPGLASEQLIAGRYLDFTIDYRDIMGEILEKHLQNKQVTALLQGYKYTSPGFYR